MTEALENTYPWRTGRSVGRTIYACPPGSTYRDGEILIGLMDSAEIADHLVALHNVWVEGYERSLGFAPAGGGTDPRATRDDDRQ